MSDIDNDDIRRLDGGLLLIFRELCRRGRTTAVAAHLGLSQSAVSHALNRLRDIFGDQLFFRRPHGLEPTARARELQPRIEALIEAMAGVVNPDPVFDPARSGRWFWLSGTEYVHSVVGPGLVRRMREFAPRGAFTFQYLRGHMALDAVRRGQLDIAMGRFESQSGLTAEPLYEDSYCVVARCGHPRIEGEIDAKTWARTGHVFVSFLSPTDDVTTTSVGEDPMPSVTTTALVPRWEMALELVSGSDSIATGPRRLAEQMADRLGLQVLDPPQPQPPWTVSMVYRASVDPGLDWFRGELRAAMG